jgi:soluble lytic murein transglycosylase-like protein
MQKIILFALLALPLTGCIGRTVVYEPDFSQKTNSKTITRPQNTLNESAKYSYTSFILKRNPKLDQERASNIAIYISRYAKEFAVDGRLVLAVMAVESSFRADVVSPTGAIGLGQLLKSTAKDMGVNDPFNPEENVMGTTKYISILSKKWQGNTERTLASYKTGAGTVTRLVKANQDFPESTKKYISDVKYFQAKIIEE